MMSLEQAIAQYEQFANVCEHHGLTASQEEFEQLAAWLRELKERRDEPEERTETHACDLISRQQAIDALARTARETFNLSDEYNHYLAGLMDGELAIKNLPTVQPERAIPLSWIEQQIEWLKSLNNGFSTLTATQISAMVKKWEGEQNATD